MPPASITNGPNQTPLLDRKVVNGSGSKWHTKESKGCQQVALLLKALHQALAIHFPSVCCENGKFIVVYFLFVIIIEKIEMFTLLQMERVQKLGAIEAERDWRSPHEPPEERVGQDQGLDDSHRGQDLQVRHRLKGDFEMKLLIFHLFCRMTSTGDCVQDVENRLQQHRELQEEFEKREVSTATTDSGFNFFPSPFFYSFGGWRMGLW